MNCTYIVTYISNGVDEKSIVVNNCISYLDAEKYVQFSRNVSVVKVEYIGESK